MPVVERCKGYHQHHHHHTNEREPQTISKQQNKMPLYSSKSKTSLEAIDLERLLSASVISTESSSTDQQQPLSNFVLENDGSQNIILLFVRNGA